MYFTTFMGAFRGKKLPAFFENLMYYVLDSAVGNGFQEGEERFQ